VPLLGFAAARGWVSESWRGVPGVALAGACFAVAQAGGGSGFIACFVGGLLLGWLAPRDRHALIAGAEGAGSVLALLTWLIFGAVVVGKAIGLVTPLTVLYAIMSLTIVRMLPVFLCLIGSGMGNTASLFVGWFGPRGLASIVFAIMVFDANLPGNGTLMATVACTVVLSVIAHGLTANPLARAFAARKT
jgi:NhaP-type Na+/H+ or K+/H+ antiporter